MDEQNQQPTSENNPEPQSAPAISTSPEDKKVRFRIAMVGFALFIIFVLGLFALFANPSLAR